MWNRDRVLSWSLSLLHADVAERYKHPSESLSSCCHTASRQKSPWLFLPTDGCWLQLCPELSARTSIHSCSVACASLCSRDCIPMVKASRHSRPSSYHIALLCSGSEASCFHHIGLIWRESQRPMPFQPFQVREKQILCLDGAASKHLKHILKPPHKQLWHLNFLIDSILI